MHLLIHTIDGHGIILYATCGAYERPSNSGWHSNIASGINTFMHDGHLYEHLYSGTTLSCANPLSSGQLIMQHAGRHTCHSLGHQQHRKNDTRVVHSPELNERTTRVSFLKPVAGNGPRTTRVSFLDCTMMPKERHACRSCPKDCSKRTTRVSFLSCCPLGQERHPCCSLV